MSGKAPRPIALTMGEPAGIGGEIALKAWLRRAEEGLSPFFVLDDPERLRLLARTIDVPVPITEVADAAAADAAFATALPVMPLAVPVAVAPGKPDPRATPAVIASIDRAVALAREYVAGAVVTNPVHKATLYEGGFIHPGHTEYLAALAGLREPPVMMLACSALRVVPVTIHMPLRQALFVLGTDMIVHAATTTAAALRRDFGIERPRLAVAGLNPHAGEFGHLGDEEEHIIVPAIERLQAAGIAADGPFPPDTMFHAGARARYDAAICMYHDQALIPLKTIDFTGGVNVTLGLPFVRTSPDHGTAFDIAGTGTADPASLIAALRMAATMARHRAEAAAAPVR